jgi:hypothetical protein
LKNEINVGFIKNTADDYDISYDEVLRIYKLCKDPEVKTYIDFYEELESFLKKREFYE